MEIDVPIDQLTRNLSASRVKTHKTCPQQYAFNYILKDDRTKPGAGYRTMGTAVHESIEEIWGENLDRRDAGILSHKFKERYREKNPDIPKYLYKNGLNCLEKAANYIEDNRTADIRQLELWHEYRINNPGFERNFTAIIDVVTDGEIWDWKTGTPYDQEGEVRDYIPDDEIIQGSIYAGAYLNKYGEYPDAVKFVYLKAGEARILDIDSENWNRMLSYAKSLQSSLETGSFPAKTGGHCGFCDYEFVCPSQDVSMANVHWEKY